MSINVSIKWACKLVKLRVRSDMLSAEEDGDIEEPPVRSGLTDLEDLGGSSLSSDMI